MTRNCCSDSQGNDLSLRRSFTTTPRVNLLNESDYRRLAKDIALYDRSKYRLSVIPSALDGSLRFHLGEPIRMKWEAPLHHSRRDWVGIYRVRLHLGGSDSEIDVRRCS